ncbi:MAG TPA: DUF3231 family protein [Negativicutes bacterium]|nr:DUF3231 family protein [Negativicutes bacterium]
MPQELKDHLTATEVGVLWKQYMGATMATCAFDYFSAKSRDTEIQQVIDYARQVTREKKGRIEAIMRSDNYPLPVGFTENDVDTQAQPLYSDRFALSYVRAMARFALTTYGLSLTTSLREDVRKHFHASISEVKEIDERAAQVEKTKGLSLREPYISSPEKAEFIQDGSFLGGFFAEKRPLSVVEIANILMGSHHNTTVSAFLMGFAQTAGSKELREFFLRCKQITQKQAAVLSDMLTSNDLPAPMSFGSEVTASTVAPFSDKLMLQHTTLILQAGLSYYGMALGLMARVDLTASYVRLMTEMIQVLEDAQMLMIRHKWLEQPPLAEDRRALVLR